MRYNKIQFVRNMKLFLLGIFVIGISSIGVNYTALASSNLIVTNETINNIDFNFESEYEDDFKVKFHNNTVNKQETSEELEATIDNSEKILNITGMEAVDKSDLLSGERSIQIDYRLAATDLDNGVLLVGGEVYDLGIIPFVLSKDEPYWKICNQNGSWGIGVPEIGIPKVVYELLPDSLGELHGYNTFTSYEDGVVKGTLTIKQLVPDKNTSPKINLTGLKLSDELNLEIVANELSSSTLVIMANYNFVVPFALEVKGKATLIMYATVNHDISGTIKDE